MKTLLLNAIATVSLVLCVAIGFFWLRSYFERDAFFWGPRHDSRNSLHTADGCSGRGVLLFQWAHVAGPPGWAVNPSQPDRGLSFAMNEVGRWYPPDTYFGFLWQ